MRVLIVEDELGVRNVFRDFVLALEHEPVAVATAEDAVAALARETFDAILLDIRLPGMSGLALLDRPEVRAADIPVVVVSGATSEDEARRCLQLGALEYVRKPVSIQRLASVLELVEPYARSRRARRAGDEPPATPA